MRRRKSRHWGCVVGLTGGIGSGKSTVLEMMRKKGAATLDSDAIVSEILKSNKKVLAKLKQKFGPGIFEKSSVLDKKALANRIFTSLSDKKYLEKLIHPLVRRRIKAGLKKGGMIAVVDVPLLYESGWAKNFDLVLVVNARRAVRMARLKAKGFKADDIRNRMKAQWPLEKKVQRADVVINNNGNINQTKSQVNKIWKQLRP